jgi:hypothetical protein
MDIRPQIPFLSGVPSPLYSIYSFSFSPFDRSNARSVREGEESAVGMPWSEDLGKGGGCKGQMHFQMPVGSALHGDQECLSPGFVYVAGSILW